MKKMNFKSRAKNAGFSLIELLLVIGFIAGALVLAFVTYPKVQATNRATLESQHLTVIASGIKNLYSTTKNFGTLENKTLIDSRIIPDDMAVDGEEIRNVWSGDVEIVADPASNLRYQITYSGIPAAECVKLATGVATNFIRVTLNGASPAIFDRVSDPVVDIDPAAITEGCNNATNELIFIGN